MTWENYLQEFDTILNTETPTGLYAEEGMLHYTKLNEARQKRQENRQNNTKAKCEGFVLYKNL